MRKYLVTAIVTCVFVLIAIFGARAVDASDGDMFNWYDPCGYTCYQWADGSGDCYPCVECELPTPPVYVTPTPTPFVYVTLAAESLEVLAKTTSEHS